MHTKKLSRPGKELLIGFCAGLALAGCATEPVKSAGATSAADGPGSSGEARPSARTSGMAAQYVGPRAGAVPATGASAWVPPAPPPAFVVTELPPAAPPAPPPAAAANRQPAPAPAARPAVDASQVARSEAATPGAVPKLSAGTREAGRRLFANYSCSTCHSLADAGATGPIGPTLDNPSLTPDYVIETVTSGRGAMPSYAGQMSDEEIAKLADYIVGAARR